MDEDEEASSRVGEAEKSSSERRVAGLFLGVSDLGLPRKR